MSKDITMDEWKRRKEFVDFTDADARLLKELRPVITKYVDEIIEILYEKILSFEETKAFFSEEDKLNHVKSMQKDYFIHLTDGVYEEDYLESRLHLGRIHEKIGLQPRWYMGGYSIYLQAAMPYVLKAFKNNTEKSRKAFMALMKLVTLDQDVAIATLIAIREEKIAAQSQELLESGTPVLQIWENVLVAPLIGTLDSNRTQLFMEKLLQEIVRTGSEVAIIDITGVPTIDSMTSQHLVETIAAVKMLGAFVVLTGVRPEIAQALVHLGIDMSDITTRSSLSSGLKFALAKLKQDQA